MTRRRPVEASLAAVARGRWGEDLAARWYVQRGFHVLDRNWRGDVGEVDLIVGREHLVVFCEVKARADDRYGPPGAAVGLVKQRRLRRLAALWFAANGTHGVEVRFDVAAVTGVHIEVIEGAF